MTATALYAALTAPGTFDPNMALHNRGMGFNLVVHRAHAFMLKGRKFHVEVDGVGAGKLKPGGHLSVDLDARMHEVRVVVGTASSKILKVQAGADGSRRVQVAGRQTSRQRSDGAY